MPERAEGETRADVARRLDDQEPARRSSGPTSYEIGSADDPDWAEDDPDATERPMTDAATAPR